MSEYFIRPAQASDAEAICKLLRDNYVAEDEVNRKYLLDVYKPELVAMRLQHNYEKILVNIIDNEILGAMFYNESGVVCSVSMFVVKQERKLSGVSAALLRYAFDNFKHCKKIVTYTDHKNKEAMAMLVRFGFIPEGLIHHGYNEGLHMITWGYFIGDIPTP